MRKSCFLICLIHSLGAFAAPLLIKNATIVSAHRIGKQEPMNVLIEKGRIKRISNNINEKVPKGTLLIEGKGKFLIPGFIDSHVHLQPVPGFNEKHMQKLGKLRALHYRQMPKSFLYYGFTTVIDLSVLDLGFIEEFMHLSIRPDVYHCANPLVPMGGYPMNQFAGQDALKKFPNALGEGFVDGQKIKSKVSVKQAIKKIKKSGAVCIKAYFEPGWGGNRWPVFSNTDIQNILKEAQSYHMPLIMHANSLLAYELLVPLNPSVMAHGLWNWNESDGSVGLPKKLRDVLDKLIQQKMGLIPTLNAMSGVQDLFNEKLLRSKSYLKVMPHELVSWYRSKEAKWFIEELIREDPRKKDPVQAIQIIEQVKQQGQRVLNYVSDFNGLVLFGTDTGGTPSLANAPGYSGFREIQLMHQAHVGLDTIFRALTLNNARIFGLEKDLGSVEEGKKANLLLLKANPLKQIDAYNQIEVVVLNGEVLPREKLGVDLSVYRSNAPVKK